MFYHVQKYVITSCAVVAICDVVAIFRHPDCRLGARGFEDLQRHPFLAGVDWAALLVYAIPAPPAFERIASANADFPSSTAGEAALDPELDAKLFGDFST
eukprot:Rmarinus@m.15123